MIEEIKNILIIFNPNAGKRKGEKFAEKIRAELNKKGITEIELFRSYSIDALNAYFADYKKSGKLFDAAICIGGDGTLGPITNAIVTNNLNLPICAFGHGTANDFPTYYKTQTSVKKFVKIFLANKTVKHDLISVNGQIAIAHGSGGAFTNGNTKYSKNAKKIFGKLAYYFGAIKRAFRIPSQKVRFNIDGFEFDENIFMFTCAITGHVAGLKGISKKSVPNDGLVDVVIIKRMGFWAKLGLGVRMMCGTVYKSKRVIYIQAKKVIATPVSPIANTFTLSDVDGNSGPAYPLEVSVYPKQIDIIIK